MVRLREDVFVKSTKLLVNIDDLPPSVRAAALGAKGLPVRITLPAIDAKKALIEEIKRLRQLPSPS